MPRPPTQPLLCPKARGQETCGHRPQGQRERRQGDTQFKGQRGGFLSVCHHCGDGSGFTQVLTGHCALAAAPLASLAGIAASLHAHPHPPGGLFHESPRWVRAGLGGRGLRTGQRLASGGQEGRASGRRTRPEGSTLQEGAARAVRGAPEPGRAVLAARQQALSVGAQAEPVDAPAVVGADPQGRPSAPHPAGGRGALGGVCAPLGRGPSVS